MIETDCEKLAHSSIERRVLKKVTSHDQISYTPFKMVLEPFMMSKEEFERLQKASMLWQKITHLAVNDYHFLRSVLGQVREDPIISPLLKIYEDSYQKNYSQHKKPRFEFFRTDYFITETETKIIEYNNCCISMAGMSSSFQDAAKSVRNKDTMPVNKSLEIYASSLNKFYCENKLDGIVIMAVSENQSNIVDQQKLIEEINKYSNFEVKRIIIDDLYQHLTVEENGDLYYQGKQKVSILYFRTGYQPHHYDQSLIANKRKIELSNCIPIPSIGAELVGQKRVQAQLSKREVAEKFLTAEEVQFLMGTVIETWDFQEENEEKCLQIEKMMENQGVSNFILKPNSEGGSHNYFGSAAYEKFKSLLPKQRPNYILTRRIAPRRMPAHIISADKNGKIEAIEEHEIDSEISIYGAVSSSGEGIVNQSDGFLVRCKPKDVNEGGLMAGTGAIGSLELECEKK